MATEPIIILGRKIGDGEMSFDEANKDGEYCCYYDVFNSNIEALKPFNGGDRMFESHEICINFTRGEIYEMVSADDEGGKDEHNNTDLLPILTTLSQ